jgi:hypothetical protein
MVRAEAWAYGKSKGLAAETLRKSRRLFGDPRFMNHSLTEKSARPRTRSGALLRPVTRARSLDVDIDIEVRSTQEQ